MRRFLVLLCLLSVGKVWAQGDTTRIDLEQFAERLFQVQDDDVNYEDIYESLLLFYTDPLNLNRADEAQLASLYILSPTQIQAFLEYRETNGALLSIYELQAIEGFDVTLIEMLLPFVTVAESRLQEGTLLQRMARDNSNRYFLFRYSRVLQQQAGYEEGRENGYAGDQNKWYGRFRSSRRDDFSYGFTFESDPGEQVGFDGQAGFDFLSAHVMVENQGPFRKIVAGDFQLQAGQGLVFGAGFNPGKGAETVNTVKRNTLGIRPYTSVLETQFFRGFGNTIKLNDLEITTFVSYMLQDANVQNDSLDLEFEQFASSIQASGLHRTPSEIANRNAITEISFGGLVDYRPNRKLQLGATAISTDYSVPLRRSDQPYNAFEFKGTQNTVMSGFGSYQWQNFNFFGEAARSLSGSTGMVGGVIASLTTRLDVAVSLRNYAKDFHTFYGNAFGEGTRAINEKGVYWGIKYRPSRQLAFAGYYDKFSFPWLRFRVDAPSEGYEWLGRITYTPSRSVTAYVQVREETKGISVTEENLSVLVPRTKRNYIFNVDYRVNMNLSMKTRLQTSHLDQNDVFTTGYALIQDINYDLNRWKFSGRMALFEAEDSDNRQYVYERDVLYAFSIPAYNYQGVRQYLMVQYSLSEAVDLWLRWARFQYYNREEVGSGQEVSQGPTRSEVKWMLRWRF